MSETYRLALERYRREQAAARIVVGGRRRSPAYTGFTSEEIQMIDASMRKYEADKLEHQQAYSGVRGKIKSLWETITHE